MFTLDPDPNFKPFNPLIHRFRYYGILLCSNIGNVVAILDVEDEKLLEEEVSTAQDTKRLIIL